MGIGKADKIYNPFFKYKFRIFSEFFDSPPSLENPNLQTGSTYLFPVDAVMGVEGLPQSGTGQTSIFCGVNAQEIIGQHFGPFPHSELIPVIREKNIFKEFLDLKKSAVFLNAYPKVFFEYIKSGKKRLSTTSLCCMLSGVKLKKAADLHSGKALSAEIDNHRWVERLNYKVKKVSPVSAAKRLLRIAENNDLTVFEYFLTDHLGHGRIQEYFDHDVKVLDEFLFYILKSLNKEKFNLVICSDHGNFEDTSIKMHTKNPAMTITSGKDAEFLSGRIKSLKDIKHAILETYKNNFDA